MNTNPNRIIITLISAFLAAGTITARAAKAPLSPADLKKEASHVLSGKVLEVTSKVQKSTIEKAKGIHRDRVFTIKLRVNTVSKGAGVKAGDQIEIVAWQPSSRIPPLPGLQGHESIPKKGDTVTLFLKGKEGKPFEPLLPNGIAAGKGAN